MASYNDNFNNGEDKDKKPVYDSFIDSIEEEIRKENYQKLWNKYGKLLSTIVIVGLLGAFGYSYWKEQDRSEKEAISAQFTLAQNELSRGNTSGALAYFREIGKSDKNNYSALAKLEYASMLHEKNDKKAIEQYVSIYNDKKVSELLRDLAYIYSINASLDLLNDNELHEKLPEFVDELSKNYVGKKWNCLALEILGYCYIKQKDFENAKKTFSALAKTEGIPDGMLERTREIMQYVDYKLDRAKNK